MTDTRQLQQNNVAATQPEISSSNNNLSPNNLTAPAVSKISMSSSEATTVPSTCTDSVSIPISSSSDSFLLILVLALSDISSATSTADASNTLKNERKRSTRVVFSQKTKDIMYSMLSTLRIQYPNMTKKEMSKYIYHHLKSQGIAVGTYQSILTWVYNNAKHQ